MDNQKHYQPETTRNNETKVRQNYSTPIERASTKI